MAQWLQQRGEASEPALSPHEHHAMRGMATAEQMQALIDASNNRGQPDPSEREREFLYRRLGPGEWGLV